MAVFPDFCKTEGRIVVLVDDALDSGGTRHQELYLKLRDKYRFGRYVSIKDPAGGLFNGRRLVQQDDFSIFATMVDYIDRKVKDIPLSRDRSKRHNDQVTELERAS